MNKFIFIKYFRMTCFVIATISTAMTFGRLVSGIDPSHDWIRILNLLTNAVLFGIAFVPTKMKSLRNSDKYNIIGGILIGLLVINALWSIGIV